MTVNKKKYFIELKADEGKIIVSKSKHYDEEQKKEDYDVQGKVVYLPLTANIEDYEEIEEEIEVDY